MTRSRILSKLGAQINFNFSETVYKNKFMYLRHGIYRERFVNENARSARAMRLDTRAHAHLEHSLPQNSLGIYILEKNDQTHYTEVGIFL